jgi:fructose-1,6-bisphosphatase-3
MGEVDERTLRALAFRYPTRTAVLGEIAELEAQLTLPKGTVHVVSDVHGEHVKLSHVVRNASGSLRPLVESLLGLELQEADITRLLSLIYYPRDAMLAALAGQTATETLRFVATTSRRLARILRALSTRHVAREVDARIPAAYRAVVRELIFAEGLDRSDAFLDALLGPFVTDEDRGVALIRVLARAVRNLSVSELVVAGDLGDRGPRIDKVISMLMQLPNVAITWGNHDASWLGATLGQPACIATVLRISLRYGRIAQLEEGYGIPVEPIEKLARAVYGDDPAERFRPKGEDLRDPLLLARMQKAITILQLKLEGQASRRNPHFLLEDRQLLHRIDHAAGTVEIDGVRHPLLDRRFPTIRPEDPYALSAEESECLEHLRRAFFDSTVLWEQMRWVVRRGAMILRRDDTLIFHGCVPVDPSGAPLTFEVDGVPRSGRALLEALETVVRRAVRQRAEADLDVLWWLWTGARSPLFGKDRMATFETYFVADPKTHEEHKNPYFSRIHEVDFCRKMLAELGGDPDRGLIVNGHVPVKLEKGESPVKRSGMAVTIDGAFSEAYGDKGYTLVLDAERTYLAQHHHFTSVEDAIARGTDIVPTVQVLRSFDPAHRVGDGDRGAAIRGEIAALSALADAYRDSRIDEALTKAGRAACFAGGPSSRERIV